MKLTDYCIEEKALEIYQRLIKDSRIDEDLCSDIYLFFIKRMKSYSQRHPDVEEVDSGFVVNAVKFIVRDLRKKEKQRQSREEVLETIHQGLLGSSEAIAVDNEESTSIIHKKLFQFVKESLNSCLIFREYALWFFMFYSVYFPVHYLEKVVFCLGYNFEDMESIFTRLRESAIRNASIRIEKADYKLGDIFNQIISCHIKMKTEQDEDVLSTMNETCTYWREEQDKALENLASIKIIPYYNEVALIVGVNPGRFYYGVNSFYNKLNNWVNQNRKLKKAV